LHPEPEDATIKGLPTSRPLAAGCGADQNQTPRPIMNRMNDFEQRLDALEIEAHRYRRCARRYQAATAALVLVVAGLAGLIAQAPGEQPIIQARGLEIVDDAGNLVLVAGSDERGGRLDLFTGEGRNVFRAASNQHGGDVNLWNVEGETLIANYATENGGVLGLWRDGGARAMRLQSAEHGAELRLYDADGRSVLNAAGGAHGGTLALTNHDGRPLLALQSTAAGGSLTVNNQAISTALSLTADQAGAGRISARNADGNIVLDFEADRAIGGALTLFDGAGARRALLSADRAGGSLSFLNSNGAAVVAAGVNGASSGGFFDIANAEGQRVITAVADDDDCGRLDLRNAGSQLVFSLDGIPNVGSALALFRESGQKAFAVGTRVNGGLLNIYNGREVPVFVAGYAEQSLGGAMSIRNGRGLPVINANADEADNGSIAIFNAEGEKPRRLQPGR
jgi:hypothetical protein